MPRNNFAVALESVLEVVHLLGGQDEYKCLGIAKGTASYVDGEHFELTIECENVQTKAKINVNVNDWVNNNSVNLINHIRSHLHALKRNCERDGVINA